MRCPGCGAEISALRDRCPHCGASTDSVFDKLEQRGERPRSHEELLRNRRTVGIVVGGVILLMAAAGGLNPFGRHLSFSPGAIHIDTGGERKGPVVTNAVDLARAYAADSAAAEKRFGGREIMVSGEFLRIVPDGYGSIDMRLKAANAEFPLGVDVAGDSVDDAKRLEPGQTVTVSCRRVAGSGNDRWLQDCAIQPTGQPAATNAPTPPAMPSLPSPPAPPPPPAR